ncbi:hypothetical protein MRB53_040764 [Persea americana]|nr:hypothetical protein MRB53_040764 [Persea americana]
MYLAGSSLSTQSLGLVYCASERAVRFHDGRLQILRFVPRLLSAVPDSQPGGCVSLSLTAEDQVRQEAFVNPFLKIILLRPRADFIREKHQGSDIILMTTNAKHPNQMRSHMVMSSIWDLCEKVTQLLYHQRKVSVTRSFCPSTPHPCPRLGVLEQLSSLCKVLQNIEHLDGLAEFE